MKLDVTHVISGHVISYKSLHSHDLKLVFGFSFSFFSFPSRVEASKRTKCNSADELEIW